jgi:hypothetical protein
VPHPASHNITPAPTRLCALVCAAVVAAYDRTWLAQPVTALRQGDDPKPETLSRLKARVLPDVEVLVERAHRRGRRKTGDRELAQLRARIACLEALLAVAASIVGQRGVRDPRLQQRLVAAAERCKEQYGLAITDFCAHLGIPERTFRFWRTRTPQPVPPLPPPPAPPAPPPKPRNEGRFALELCPPDLQAMADTTHVRAFGVDLRVCAAQDPGRRFQELLAAFSAQTEENTDVIVDVLEQALAELPGAQVIVDQGTPYLAAKTRQACDAMEIDHQPQKEGAPTEKSPIERAFETVKTTLRPIFDLTNRIADAIPLLRRPELARAATTLLFACYLRVYSGGRRHLVHPLAAHDPAALHDVVPKAREQARAENRSRKLFLQQLWADYNFEPFVSRDAFVRQHRIHALEDLHAADRILQERACRCGVRRCDWYFGGILRRVAAEGRARRAAELARREAERARRRVEAAREADEQHFEAHPDQRLARALECLRIQHQIFWMDGDGWARAELRIALRDLYRRGPLVWQYDVDAMWQTWCATYAGSQSTLDAISGLLAHEREAVAAAPPPIMPSADCGTLGLQARRENQRPPPSSGLTN